MGRKSKKDVRKKEERIGGGGGIRVSVACEGMLREKREEREKEKERKRGGFSLHFVAF